MSPAELQRIHGALLEIENLAVYQLTVGLSVERTRTIEAVAAVARTVVRNALERCIPAEEP